MTDSHTDSVEAFIREAYARNFELLRQEGVGSITADLRAAGLNQVLLYWRHLREIASRVTDTEVLVQLPGQRTPAGRAFGIEGVVDVVREGETTYLYDIKAHDADLVRQNPEGYLMQLTLYAHIWGSVHNDEVDGLAVIATSPPPDVDACLPAGRLVDEITTDEQRQLEEALKTWQPVVEMPYDPARVEEAVQQFGAVVDAIEEGRFDPPPPEVLHEPWLRTGQRFAARVCGNCDARFSCGSFRAFAAQAAGKHWQMAEFAQYFYDDYGSEMEQEQRLSAALDALAPGTLVGE